MLAHAHTLVNEGALAFVFWLIAGGRVGVAHSAMNPSTPPVSPGPGGAGVVKGVAKKWIVKGVDKQPAGAAKTVPPKAVKAAAAPEPAEGDGVPRAKSAPPAVAPGAPAETVKKMLAKSAAAPAPAGDAAKTSPPAKAVTLRKVPAQAEVVEPPRATTLRAGGLARTSGLSKTAARLSTPPTPPGAGAEVKKNASSPNLLVRPNKPLPSVTPTPSPPPPAAPAAEEVPPAPPVPAVPEPDEDGPPPEVPAFDQPPPLPVFDPEPPAEDPEEESGMLDAMFEEIGETRPAQQPAPHRVVAAVAATAAAPEGLSDSFLDSVFDAINPAPAPTLTAVVATRSSKPGDVTDSFLDSVFNMTAAAAAPAPQQQADEEPEDGDEDDLLGAVIGEIEGAASAPVKSSIALLEEEEAQKSRARQEPGRRASVTVAPAGPLMRSGVIGSPGMARPRVKSFAPSTIAPVDTATIRARGSRARADSGGKEKKMSEAKVRSVMAELKRSGSGMELVGRVVYDVGRTNPPSALRLWGNKVTRLCIVYRAFLSSFRSLRFVLFCCSLLNNVKALLVVAGDKIYMRTLGGEENLGNIAEAGAKVVFQ